MTQLECELLDIINDTIKGKYIGKLEAGKDGNMYCLALYLNRTTTPAISLMKECKTEQEFKDFVREEIKKRKLENVSYWSVRIDYEGQDDLTPKKNNDFIYL